MMRNLLPRTDSSSSVNDRLKKTALIRFWFFLLLSGFFVVSSSLLVMSAAIAANPSPPPSPTPESLTSPTLTAVSPLPAPLANAVRRDLSKQTGIPAGKLRVVEASRKTWSDGCLGLARPDEFCMQALVQGWRVVLTDGKRRWVYRTDTEGRNIRMETRNAAESESPNVVATTGLQMVSKQVAQPTKIPRSELPPALAPGIVFRTIASGGITGSTYETTLWSDGRLVRVLMNRSGTRVKPEVRYLSPEQVQQFQQLVQLNHMQRYDRLSYPAVPGSADFITVTVTSRIGTIRYANSMQNYLPTSLRTIVQAWGELVNPI